MTCPYVQHQSKTHMPTSTHIMVLLPSLPRVVHDSQLTCGWKLRTAQEGFTAHAPQHRFATDKMTFKSRVYPPYYFTRKHPSSPSEAIMEGVRLSSLEDGVPTECHSLLSSPSSERDLSFPVPPIAHRYAGSEQDNTISVARLGASALNFFLSGIAMVAVGVRW